jgi:hypothetical protein
MGKIKAAGVLRLRAPSAVSYDQSLRRFAQDDGFVGGLKKYIPNKLGRLEGKHPNKLPIVGLLAFLAPLTSKFALA